MAVVTPFDKGAVGNGVTDDASALQSWLDTVGAAGGGDCYLPGYDFLTSVPLNFNYPNVRVIGEGFKSRIKFTGATGFKMGDTTQRTYINLTNLRISGPTGAGVGVDMSHFAICKLENLFIDNVLGGVLISSNDAFYNLLEFVRIQCSGVGSYGIKIDSGANENTVSRARIVTDANSTGVRVDSHSNGLYEVDVETGATLGIDLGANAHGTLIVGCYLEANATNLRIASGAKGVAVVGGTIESASVKNVDDLGAVGLAFFNSYVNFAAYHWSSQLQVLNPGTNPSDALQLDMAQPSGASVLRDSHSLLLRGAYTDSGSAGHNIDWRILGNTTAVGGSKLRFMNRIDAASYVEKMSIDGSGVLITGGRAVHAGPVQTAYSNKTAAYTIVANTDSVVTADATSAAFQITLPTAVNIAGRRFTVKRINSGANAVTVGTTSSQTIDGAATKVLGSQWAFIEVVSDGANWVIVSLGGTVT